MPHSGQQLKYRYMLTWSCFEAGLFLKCYTRRGKALVFGFPAPEISLFIFCIHEFVVWGQMKNYRVFHLTNFAGKQCCGVVVRWNRWDNLAYSTIT